MDTTVPADATPEGFDMIVVGAGISGLNMAYRYQTAFPKSHYTLIEAREHMGGTWDLMRYPGIRSDSDLYTFGFAWRPWPKEIPIAEASEILEYMNESAEEYGIDKHIRYRHRLREARWSSRLQAWNLKVEITDKLGDKSMVVLRTRYIVLGTG
jgi:cation diffusion facilitator CzcD-associated flavoprotein CzcO